MSNTQKIRTNIFKLVLIVVAAAAPIYITSSYKTESSAKVIRFQKSINEVPKKKKPLSPQEMQRKFKELSVY